MWANMIYKLHVTTEICKYGKNKWFCCTLYPCIRFLPVEKAWNVPSMILMQLSRKSVCVSLAVWSEPSGWQQSRQIANIHELIRGLYIPWCIFSNDSTWLCIKLEKCTVLVCESHPMKNYGLWHMRPSKAQIKLRIRAFWLGPSVFSWGFYGFIFVKGCVLKKLGRPISWQTLHWLHVPKARISHCAAHNIEPAHD